ncbi:hypothetical protein, partial [Rhizobium leguminosarum]|uniref:hypothetical protein n=1 Tax=Rhizobium leguminosarum TaxID=384 RepID=UPI003F9E111D
IIEKTRYYFPSGNQITQQLFFYYDLDGNISEIKMAKPTSAIPSSLKFTYNNGNLVTATISYDLSKDSMIYSYNNDNNIVSA